VSSARNIQRKSRKKLVWYDLNREPATYSPEYYPYDVVWGLIKPELRERIQKDVAELKQYMLKTTNPSYKTNIDWLIANFEFTLLLDDTSRSIEPALRLRDNWLKDKI
jgi:hypothetical protein